MSAPLADDVQTSLGADLRLQRYEKKCICAKNIDFFRVNFTILLAYVQKKYYLCIIF